MTGTPLSLRYLIFLRYLLLSTYSYPGGDSSVLFMVACLHPSFGMSMLSRWCWVRGRRAELQRQNGPGHLLVCNQEQKGGGTFCKRENECGSSRERSWDGKEKEREEEIEMQSRAVCQLFDRLCWFHMYGGLASWDQQTGPQWHSDAH